MRAVVDPGVLVSGLISRTGPPAQIIDLWVEGAYELVVSPRLLEELAEVISRPKFADIIQPAAAELLIAELRAWTHLVEDPPAGPALTPDPDDDYIVSLARVSGANVIVSGDRHLTDLGLTEPRVLTPRAFVDLLDSLQ